MGKQALGEFLVLRRSGCANFVKSSTSLTRSIVTSIGFEFGVFSFEESGFHQLRYTFKSLYRLHRSIDPSFESRRELEQLNYNRKKLRHSPPG